MNSPQAIAPEESKIFRRMHWAWPLALLLLIACIAGLEKYEIQRHDV